MMKKLLSIILSLIIVCTCFGTHVKAEEADNEYEDYTRFSEIHYAIRDAEAYTQIQVSRATIRNGKIHVAKGDGQCNASSLTTLLNRRLVYDGKYCAYNRFRINDVFRENGVTLVYEDMKKAQAGETGYNCYVFKNEKDTGGWAHSGKKYTNGNGTATYTVRSIQGNDWRNAVNNPEGITDFYEYVVYLLMMHPEGVCVRNVSGDMGHVAVIIGYRRVSGRIQLYVLDPATMYHKNYKDSAKFEDTYIGHVCSDLEKGFNAGRNFFTYLEGSKPVMHCDHSAEYFDREISQCTKCGRFNYTNDTSRTITGMKLTVIDGGTRLREGPYDNKTSGTLAKIPGGTQVTGVKAVTNVFGNTWYKVRFNGQTGWVFHEKVTMPKAKSPFSFGSYSRQLRNGSKGSDVKYLQQALNITMNSRLDVDGAFGPKTRDAVKAFQRKYGLDADGIFGPKSNKKMEEVLHGMGY